MRLGVINPKRFSLDHRITRLWGSGPGGPLSQDSRGPPNLFRHNSFHGGICAFDNLSRIDI
jgi:hypothetical protein